MIIGAGLAGLITAHALQKHNVFEAMPCPTEGHKALLRFRSKAVSDLVGIPFREVTVRKGIWFQGGFVQPNILVANLYSRKVLSALHGERSIWNVEPAQRFIAPPDFYWQMVEHIGSRIVWNQPVDLRELSSGLNGTAVISTAPLSVTLDALQIPHQHTFAHKKIEVQRFLVPGADVHQTIYFPSKAVRVYRASITGDLLIVEFADNGAVESGMDAVLTAFGLGNLQVKKLEAQSQRYGKIAPIPDAERKALLHRLTAEYGVFSIGRFATWRNILLDDVVKDITVVKRLLQASSYERRMASL